MKKFLLTLSLVLGCTAAFAQYQVKGVVEDALGPVIGATVMEQGTANGTSTGLDGDFLLTVKSASSMVEVSCIGYASQVFPASAVPSKILLEEDTNFLDEVVVVGYGTQKAKDLTAPIVNVKGDELSKQTAANPMSALQGMVSGVQITQSGAPGAGPSVKIRGVGSIGDYANPLYIVDGAFMDNIDFLSSSDIESLTVLKDASAAAIYGVRAANGVILVTTKKGETGRVRVAYDGYAGLQVPTNILKMANTEQYVEMYNLSKVSTAPAKNVSDYNGVSTDWYKELVHPALTHSHALDLSGGTEKTNYSVGLSYYYQDGIMNYTVNNYDRINLRARLDQTMTGWLKVGFNTVVSTYNRHNPNSGVFYQAFVNPPVYGVYSDANTDAYPEKFDSPQRYGYANAYGNPAAAAYYNNSKETGLKTVFSAYAEATITEKLKFKTSYNLDFNFYDAQNYTPEHFVGGSQGTSVSSLSKTYGYGTYRILDNTLTYSDRVGAHAFTAMVGQSTRMQYTASLTGTARSVPDFDDASRYLRNGSYKNQNASDAASRYNGVSAFARGTYNYKEKYLATVTLRADGSSKYQEKWGIFPSIGLGWNISDEDFMKGKGIDYLKLRASWGMLGNDNVPANDINIVGQPGMSTSAVFGQTVVDGMGAQTVYQNYLKWEVVTETNLGADFALLGNRLSGELDLYRRVTNNVVFHAPIATGGGVASLLANNGKVLNQGIELSLKWADSVSDDFSYNVGFNATINQNKVLELNGRENIPGGLVNGAYATMTQVGYPIGAFWGYKVDGVYKNDAEAKLGEVNQPGAEGGHLIYHDFAGNEDGTPDGKITSADRVYLGSPLPWLIMGASVGANWKAWDFSMTLSANIGNKIFNRKRLNKQVFADGNYDYDFYKNAWREDAPSSTYPSPKALRDGLQAQANSFFVEDGSMFRIQNVQLGYTFRPSQGIRARAYVSAQRPLSLFGYHGFTTEIGGSPIENGIDGSSVYPMQAIYTIGVNLNF
ncbi:MAG: TonB-dependent receptor [Bacteroidales bacterium]|nr:TonB-dependent receptor [Bacteroidales bacterium]